MFSIHHRTKALAGAVAAIVSVTLLTTADAECIPAGNDYFETVPNGTHIDFSNHPIPPDFFGPGSDPFTAIVPLQGVPLDPATSGTADTIRGRTVPINGVCLNRNKPPVEVHPQMVALNLSSINPITVTYNGGQNPELWTLTISLPPNQQQQQGSMTITQTDPKGGTYTSTLPVITHFTFIRLRDRVRVESAGTGETIGHIAELSFKADRSYNLLISPHFCPSCDLTGAPLQSTFVWSSQGSDLIIQIVRPATVQ